MNGFMQIRSRNIEGSSMRFSPSDLKKLIDNEKAKEDLFSLLNNTGSLPDLSGITEQFLIIAAMFINGLM